MKKVRLTDLNESVRSFFEQIRGNEIVTLVDQNGNARFSIAPFLRASEQERNAALERLERLQEKTRQAMDSQGIGEADIDRALQEDD